MQTLILKSPTTSTVHLRKQTILRSTSVEQPHQQEQASNGDVVSEHKLSTEPSIDETKSKNSLENSNGRLSAKPSNGDIADSKIAALDTSDPDKGLDRNLEIKELDKFSEKELRVKYGWKDEYNYFGVKFKAPLIWSNIIFIGLLHILSVYTYWILKAKGHWYSIFFAYIMGGIAGFGVTAGAHRLWCHRSYKAKLPLQIILAMCFSASGQNTIPEWVRDHRVHHKFSETDADPHNSNRGFFFAHVGWLMMRKHPAVLAKGKCVDMSDIMNDPLIQFHTKYFTLLKILFCFLIPTMIPVYCWGEDWFFAFCSQCLIRYMCSLNFTWSVNSLAHLYGKRPYDNRINPVENKFVAFIAMGEGWHNYHHVFPWDYKAAELAYTINITTFWIDLFAKLGWAYDRKQPSHELVKAVTLKHGDGTHADWGHKEIPAPQKIKTKPITNGIDERRL